MEEPPKFRYGWKKRQKHLVADFIKRVDRDDGTHYAFFIKEKLVLVVTVK